MMSPRLILASSSPARKVLLERLQVTFEIIPPHIDESPLSEREPPKELALRLAIEKAKTAGKNLSNAHVIGSDQVIMCDGVRLDKPMTVENAEKQLSWVSGRSIISYTGLCLWNTKTNIFHTGVEFCEVYFRKLSPEMIRHYIKRDNPLHCAGSIKAESLGVTLFTKLESRDPTALIGLPLILLTDFMLEEQILVN